MNRVKIGIIGLGRMGRKHLRELVNCDFWDVKYVCDIDPEKEKYSKEIAPNAIFTTNEDDIFDDSEIECVGLYALADSRPGRIKKAIATGKHVICEKPLAYKMEDEFELVKLSKTTDKICTVNLYLRNAWYTKEMKDFIKSGEIGDVAIIRICHMTPGLSPAKDTNSKDPHSTIAACIM